MSRAPGPISTRSLTNWDAAFTLFNAPPPHSIRDFPPPPATTPITNYCSPLHSCRPCHYLAADRTAGCLVLAVRGSLQLGDIATDLDASPLQYTLAGQYGHVHPGLMTAAAFVLTSTQPALQRAADAFPGWPLLVTGEVPK